jgi:hypothetical protein
MFLQLPNICFLWFFFKSRSNHRNKHPLNCLGKLTLNKGLKMMKDRKDITFHNKRIISYTFCMSIHKNNKIKKIIRGQWRFVWVYILLSVNIWWPNHHPEKDFERSHEVTYCENWTEKKKLDQEYTKHSAKFDNRQQDAPHPLK